MYITTLNIAELNIELETENPIHINESFAPFLAHRETGGSAGSTYRAVFRQTDRLDIPAEDGRIRTRDFDVCEESPGRYVRFYRDGREEKYYAASRFDRKSRTVQIQYLAGNEKSVSETGNSFFHIEWENLLLDEAKMILHAACVRHPKLGGILFSGPSGVGKSTQADLWCTYQGADLLNGDRTILGRGGQGWMAYGSPYAGSSRCYVNESCSVTAVVILKQVPSCQIRRMRAAEVFRAVYAGLTVNNWDSRFVDRICDLAGELIREVPVYELACTPDRYAAELLYSELQKGYRDAEQRPED